MREGAGLGKGRGGGRGVSPESWKGRGRRHEGMKTGRKEPRQVGEARKEGNRARGKHQTLTLYLHCCHIKSTLPFAVPKTKRKAEQTLKSCPKVVSKMKP